MWPEYEDTHEVAGENSQPGTYYKTLDPQVDFG